MPDKTQILILSLLVKGTKIQSRPDGGRVQVLGYDLSLCIRGKGILIHRNLNESNHILPAY